MISIIICSRKSELSQELLVNIEETVGSDYELIIIDNSQNKYSIFEAYNLGIEKSCGDYLCFIHDDILIHSKDWGNVVHSIFESDIKIGLIGVAGAKVKTKMPSAWWDCEDSCKRISLIQHFANGEIKDWQIGWNNEVVEEVVAIDGVFMLARRVEEIKFNQKLKGFHNYDLNLSFEYIKKGLKVVVAKEIIIEHFSIGKLNESWYNSALQVHKIYKEILPLTTQKKYEFKKQEFKNGSRFVDNLLEYKMVKEAVDIWLKLIWLKPKSKFHFQFLNKLKRIHN